MHHQYGGEHNPASVGPNVDPQIPTNPLPNPGIGNRVLNPPMPYHGMVPKLVDGLMIVIQGRILPAATRFMLQFRCGASGDRAYQLIARLEGNLGVGSKDELVGNSLDGGRWGVEERCYMNLSLKKEEHFECLILITRQSYKVAFCGTHACEFRHRVGMERVESLSLQGDGVRIQSIFYKLSAGSSQMKNEAGSRMLGAAVTAGIPNSNDFASPNNPNYSAATSSFNSMPAVVPAAASGFPNAQPYPSSQPYPTSQPNPVSQPYSSSQPYPTSQPNLVSQPYPSSQPYPTSHSNPVSQPYPSSQPFPMAQPNPVSQSFPSSQPYPMSEFNPVNPASQPYPSSQPYSATQPNPVFQPYSGIQPQPGSQLYSGPQASGNFTDAPPPYPGNPPPSYPACSSIGPPSACRQPSAPTQLSPSDPYSGYQSSGFPNPNNPGPPGYMSTSTTSANFGINSTSMMPPSVGYPPRTSPQGISSFTPTLSFPSESSYGYSERAGLGFDGLAGPGAVPPPNPYPSGPEFGSMTASYPSMQTVATNQMPAVKHLTSGLKPGQVLNITATPRPNANSFTLSMKDSERTADVEFYIHVDLALGRWVRNSRLSGVWGAEESFTPYFPFKRGKPFAMLIRCEHDSFMIAVDNQHLIEFKKRSRTYLQTITYICLDGDLDLQNFE